jgi:hypothetical protein
MFVRKDAVCAQRVLSVGICMLWGDGLGGITFRANGMPCKREYSAYFAPFKHTGIIPLFQHTGIVQHPVCASLTHAACLCKRCGWRTHGTDVDEWEIAGWFEGAPACIRMRVRSAGVPTRAPSPPAVSPHSAFW